MATPMISFSEMRAKELPSYTIKFEGTVKPGYKTDTSKGHTRYYGELYVTNTEGHTRTIITGGPYDLSSGAIRSAEQVAQAFATALGEGVDAAEYLASLSRITA